MTQARAKGPIPFYLDDLVVLRKAHPCGGDTWRVIRLGADIGLRCATCDRRVLVGRRDLEKDMKRFAARGPLAPVD